MLFEVLEPNFIKFKQELNSVRTIDEIILNHNKFLDLCLSECLLTN